MGITVERGLSVIKIGVQPFRSQNLFIKNTEDALSRFGEITDVPSLLRLVLAFFTFSLPGFDVIVLNWVENELVSARSGRLSPFGVAKAFLRIFLLKMSARRLIFVRHNNFPHSTNTKSRRVVEFFVKNIESLCSISITLSGHNVSSTRLYVPHPIYRRVIDPADVKEMDFYAIFGRIDPYKNIVSLVELLSKDVSVVIAGPCKYPNYLDKIKAAAKGKRIQVMEGFLAEEEAQRLVMSSRGVVLAHENESMVVSGSYFFAVSTGVPVYAIRTPFLEWMKESRKAPGLTLFDSLPELAMALEAKSEPVSSERIRAFAEEEFGIDSVARHWQKVFRALSL